MFSVSNKSILKIMQTCVTQLIHVLSPSKFKLATCLSFNLLKINSFTNRSTICLNLLKYNACKDFFKFTLMKQMRSFFNQISLTNILHEQTYQIYHYLLILILIQIQIQSEFLIPTCASSFRQILLLPIQGGYQPRNCSVLNICNNFIFKHCLNYCCTL